MQNIEIENDHTIYIKHYEDTKSDRKDPKADITEHLKSVDEIVEYYFTSLEHGLSTETVDNRLFSDGYNQLTPPTRKNPFLIYFKQWIQPLALLPLIAGFLCFILYGITHATNTVDESNLYLGIVLLVVVALNALIESIQELKTNSVLSGFSDMIPHQTMVYRDSNWVKIDSKCLVKGDIVKVKAGDKIPADIRIYEQNQCKVDNSSLTGEVEPCARRLENKHSNPLEADNLAFFGTLCIQGDCKGIVIRTGDNTVIGSIAQLSNASTESKSPLQIEINKFVKLIASVAIVLALIFYGLGFAVGIDPIDNFQFFIGIFVANVPQGLPGVVSMLLTIAARKLSKRKVLVKDLRGVDTLGAITLLATDKTGTLTQNRMTVVNFWTNNTHYYSDPGVPLTESSQLFEPLQHKLFLDTLQLNLSATFDESDMNPDPMTKRINGDATESGILRFLATTTTLLKDKTPIFSIPFNSVNKWALTINKYKHSQGNLILCIKGAPERIMRMCVQNDNDFNKAYTCMASKGQRVLAVAYKLLDSTYDNVVFTDEPANYPTTDYTFMGLIGLIDPPKERVSRAIGSCQSAGIRVMMVTGDHPLTAEAIARQVGLLIGETKQEVATRLNRPLNSITEDEYQAVVVHGESLDALSNREWDKILNKYEIVFARTSPKQKLEIVARCQAKGHIVGVTGDGVNDSPALKRADLGISMNLSGSDVSKEAAKMILMDDNFATIVEGIAEGRLIFANLKKAIRYSLSHVTPINLVFLIHIIVPVPVAMTPFLVLMLDLFTDPVPAITYAFEVEEDDLMEQAPRRTVVPIDLVAIDDQDAINLSEIPNFQIEPIRKKRIFKSLWNRYKDAVWTKKMNKGDERLIDFQLLFVSYIQMGIIIHIGALIGFFFIFSWGIDIEGQHYALQPNELYGFRQYEERLKDIWGIADTNKCRRIFRELLHMAQTGYFIVIVCAQACDLIVTKVKYKYAFTTRLFINKWSYLGMLFSFGWAGLVCYVPAINTLLQTKGPRPEIYIIGLLTGFGVVLYDTIRKWILKLGYFGGLNDRPADCIDGIKHVLERD